MSIPRKLTFREWSILVDLGADGVELLAQHRQLRAAARDLVHERIRNAHNDALRTGTGVLRMGQGCAPIRIDPSRFYA